MPSKAGLPPPEIVSLKLILAVSNAYYANILPLYRKSLEHHRLRHGKGKNLKGLRVKITPARRAAAINVLPRALRFPAPQPKRNLRKRPASSVSRGPVEPSVEPPCKRLRPFPDATTTNIRTLSQIPLIGRLQDTLSLPSVCISRQGRWIIMRQRVPPTIGEPPSIPEDLLSIKVPPGLEIGRASK